VPTTTMTAISKQGRAPYPAKVALAGFVVSVIYERTVESRASCSRIWAQ
jgi:hypothetical protein